MMLLTKVGVDSNGCTMLTSWLPIASIAAVLSLYLAVTGSNATVLAADMS